MMFSLRYCKTIELKPSISDRLINNIVSITSLRAIPTFQDEDESLSDNEKTE
jgi:hypothetical protein